MKITVIYTNFALIVGVLLLGLVSGQESGGNGNDLVIQAPDVSPFGRWGRWDNCSQGRIVTAFQVKVKKIQYFLLLVVFHSNKIYIYIGGRKTQHCG